MERPLNPLGKEIRTIADLGIETSEDYAKNRENIDTSLFKDSSHVSSQAKIIATASSYSSELSSFLLSLGKTNVPSNIDLRRALFTPPLNYKNSRSSVFGELLVPCLGSLEKQEALLEKIKDQEGAGPFVNLLTFLQEFNELTIEFNSKRVQYQKG